MRATTVRSMQIQRKATAAAKAVPADEIVRLALLLPLSILLLSISPSLILGLLLFILGLSVGVSHLLGL